MKTAVFGDIHSNLQTWKKAFEIMENENVDRFLCTGDLVGYGPQPNEVVSDIRSKKEDGLNIEIVLGNHDSGTIDSRSLSRFNVHAKQALTWTKGQLSKKNQEFLANLPNTWRDSKTLLAHGTPNNPIWEYLRPWNAASILGNHQFEICFVGHTHLLQIFTLSNDSSKPEKKAITNPTNLHYSNNKRLIVNVGSIGQPRDYDSRSSFIIWDDKKRELEIIRCKYDIEKTQELIYKTDLPDFEAQRLAKGQ